MKNLRLYKKYLEILFLTFIFFAVIFSRTPQISPYKIHKDSYKLLFIATATVHNSSVISYYPEYEDYRKFKPWWPSKWIFGYIVGGIVKIEKFIGLKKDTNLTIEQTSHNITIVSTAISALLLYLLLRKYKLGIYFSGFSSILLLISKSSIFWNGFIITDTFAGMLLLLYLYQNKKSPSFIFASIFVVLFYLTRPEMLVIPLIIEFTKLLKLYVEKSILSKKILLSIQILIIALCFLTFPFNALLKESFHRDLGLWILLFSSLAFSIFKGLNFKKETLFFYFQISTLFIILLVIYFVFNHNIPRYINIVLPLLIILISINLKNLFRTIPQSTKKIALASITLILSYQIFLDFKTIKTTIPDYYSEISKEVLTYAKTNNIKTLYTRHQEAYIWNNEKLNTNINVKYLVSLDNQNFEPNSIVIKDSYSQYAFSKWPTDKMELKKQSYSKANFSLNNKIVKGFYEIWQPININ